MGLSSTGAQVEKGGKKLAPLEATERMGKDEKRGGRVQKKKNMILLDTKNLETVASFGVHKVLALDLEWGDCGGGASQGTNGCQQTRG